MSEEWSDAELEAAVAGYITLLRGERAGEAPSKAAVREQLLSGPLAGRSAGSVEYRMQNISAVLQAMGRPWIEGYKPAGNVGPTNSGKIRRLVERLAPDSPAASRRVASGPVSTRRVYVANFGREKFEWPKCLAGNYIATMQDRRAHEYWAAGDRAGYIEFAVSTLKTAKGLPPTRQAATCRRI